VPPGTTPERARTKRIMWRSHAVLIVTLTKNGKGLTRSGSLFELGANVETCLALACYLGAVNIARNWPVNPKSTWASSPGGTLSRSVARTNGSFDLPPPHARVGGYGFPTDAKASLPWSAPGLGLIPSSVSIC
jgi:hypothetical protein